MFDATEATAPAEALAVEATATPRKPKVGFKRTCLECGVEFRGAAHSRFCSTPCRAGFHNRSMKRGKVAIPLMLAWREGKNHAGKRGDPAKREVAQLAFRELCAASDMWNAEDKAAGRVPMIQYVEGKLREGWKAIDL